MSIKDKIIDEVVNKFLSWKLPEDFCPDGGIIFSRMVNGREREGNWWPVGTNLFTAEQAKQMFEYLLADHIVSLEERLRGAEKAFQVIIESPGGGPARRIATQALANLKDKP